MTIPVQPVTCRFFDQDGSPIAAKVSFKLTNQEIYNGIIVGPQADYITCDPDTGVGVIYLFPNELGINGSQYEVKAIDSVSNRRLLPNTLCTVPNRPSFLDLILDQEPYPELDQALVAINAANNALIQVNEKIELVSEQVEITVANANTTILNAEQTAADRVQTGLDRMAIEADLEDLAEAVAATAADRVAVAADRVAVAADKDLVALDALTVAENLAATEANVISSATSAETAELQAVKATTQAELASTSKLLATAQATAATDAAQSASVERVAAEVARDASQLSAGVYPTVEAGLLATSIGEYFSVPSALDTEYLILYLHADVDMAVEVKRYPSIAGVEYTVANVVHVKSNGDDASDGLSWKTAVRTIERALAMAWLNSEPTLIDWAPEAVVYSNGHLDMPDNCVIKATHRTVFLRPNPGYEERNQFRMGSGCFLEGVMFEGWRVDSLTNPTEGFAVSFRPGAVIRRVPYAHKIAARSVPNWGVIAPPLDMKNANPEVPRGGGVVLADGLVCSQNSIFANIMTWGATPVSANGIGYCAKNGALINAVNAVSLWAHKHFQALSGGQIILSACSTQFGDYSLHAKGYRNLVLPNMVEGLTAHEDVDDALLSAEQDIIDSMWGALVFYEYAVDWTAKRQALTRADAATFLQCLRWTLKTANQQPMLDFSKGLFNALGEPVFLPESLPAFIFSFNNMREAVKALDGISADAATQVDLLVDALIETVQDPMFRKEPSRITAIGHTWTAVMSGVALTKTPPARNNATITDSILEEDEGLVIASGQDDQGNALFVGGLQITADTGELGGPPFDHAVRRVATRAAISRSF